MPIQSVGVRDSVQSNITYETMLFPLWEAAIAAGATLDELARIEDYPKQFQAMLVAWHQTHNLVRLHEQDAVAQANKGKNR